MPPAAHMAMMMNSSCSADPGEASDGGCAYSFLDDLFGDRRRSSGDLFDLVWPGGAGGSSGSMEVQPASSHLPSSSPRPPATVVTMPPSEDEMAAWLYPIVRGDDLGVAADPDGHPGATMLDDHQATDHKRETQEKCRAQDSTRTKERRKKETGGTRKSHYAETHNLTEKRRRCKINEQFKTLQQLVPGCDDKSNQASTLDQTIQYMKSLQQQIKAMSFGCGGMKPAAVYPVVPAPYLPLPATAAAAAPGVLVRGHFRPAVVLAPPPAMVPFGPPLQYPVSMASAPMLYPVAPNNM